MHHLSCVHLSVNGIVYSLGDRNFVYILSWSGFPVCGAGLIKSQNCFFFVFCIVVHVDSILVSLRDNVSVVVLGSAQNPCTSSSFIFLIVR